MRPPQTVFYSWQADLPNRTNRTFIEDALERAAKTLRADDSLKVELRVDRDTADIAGSPAIADTILQKIANADVFVPDVSIVARRKAVRPARTRTCCWSSDMRFHSLVGVESSW